MLRQDIRMIMEENRRYLQMLEYYDRTGRLPARKERASFTLKEINLDKLHEASKKTGNSMSGILDGLIENCLDGKRPKPSPQA